jgi:predicted O-methyltransferase YrrM
VDVAALLRDAPLLHSDQNGHPTTYQLGGEALGFIGERAGPDSRTLEVGAGLSTLVFTVAGARHTAITPSQEEADKVLRYCATNGIATERLEFIIEPSQTALPKINTSNAIDLALIDGSHGFPIPFLDWYYINEILRVGGLLLIDDVEIWTGRVLRDFLRSEPEWTHLGDLGHGRTAIFRKDRPAIVKEWCWQPYVVSRSDLSLMVGTYDVSQFPGANRAKLTLDLVKRMPTIALSYVRANVFQRAQALRQSDGAREEQRRD